MKKHEFQKIVNTAVREAMKNTSLPSSKNIYQKTELLLYNYNNIKQANDDRKKLNIDNREIHNRVQLIDNALETIANDPYYILIEQYYFENKNQREIADKYQVEESTLSRNRKRLVNKLAVYLFADEFINDLYN